MTELEAKAQSWGIFSGHCTYFFLWSNPLSAPPLSAPRAKGIQQKASETSTCILGQSIPCSLPSFPPAITFFFPPNRLF